MKLKYVGNGGFVFGVPARDVNVKKNQATQLVKTGLYEYAKPKETHPAEATATKRTRKGG